ncbi:MAG: VWA domain-containing protein [Bacteroidales bacterium]|nr:VWA domain-containing protein [Bacteroidales bacterium]
MKKKAIILFFILLTSPLLLLKSNAQRPEEQEPPLTRILFIFDASQSMFARWQSDMRINIARNLLIELLDSLDGIDNTQLALRVYGHQKRFPPQDCDDTRLEIPFADNNVSRIKQRLRTITPRGTTPIAMSLERAQHDFPPCDNCRNIIVLITDGIEECGGDPCAVSRELQKKGIILKPFVIGIGRDFRADFECVGIYFDATSEVEFRQSLNIVISQALDNTTAQVNLLDVSGIPSETNVPITFYDNHSGRIMNNFVHTLNFRGLPDTLYYMDPLMVYDMVVHTMPPVRVNNIKINPGRHNIIHADVPQGSLTLLAGGTTQIKYKAIVRQAGHGETLTTQIFGETENYLVGRYDLEILSLPRIQVKGVEISQSHTTKVEIPQPGIAVIRLPAQGFAKILHEEGNELKEIHVIRENVTSETLYLQPGNYRVVFRSKVSNLTVFSIDRPFRIQSGISTMVNLNQ